MRGLVPLLLAGALLAPAPLAAQDFAGSWEMTRETPRGTMTQTLVIARDGDGWKGTMTFMEREIDLKDVKVEGNTLTFTMEMGPPPNAGGGGRGPMSQTFKGTLEGDEIQGEMDGPRGPRPMVLTRKKG